MARIAQSKWLNDSKTVFQLNECVRNTMGSEIHHNPNPAEHCTRARTENAVIFAPANQTKPSQAKPSQCEIPLRPTGMPGLVYNLSRRLSHFDLAKLQR